MLERPNPTPIESHEQYADYLDEIAELCGKDPPPGTADSQRLLALAEVVEKFEDENFPFP